MLQVQTNPVFDGDYKSLQFSFNKRMANRWSGRVAYTLQKSHYVGLGNPDARRVWLDNDPGADYGRFLSDRPHVLAATGTWNPWRSLSVAAVVSAIRLGDQRNRRQRRQRRRRQQRPADQGHQRPALPDPVRDRFGRTRGDQRPHRAGVVSRSTCRSATRFRSRPGSTASTCSTTSSTWLNRENLVNPLGNRASPVFMIPTAAQFARQMQFGVRVRF